jgi:hypothetical protein
MAIKILSGWSDCGGSTTAFINLCNLLNDNGIDTTFYGPHLYHLNKCKSNDIRKVVLNEDDIIIYHFLNVFKTRPPVKKFVLSLHEKHMYPLKEKPISIFDKIHFLNEKQIEWHGIDIPKDKYFICPNVLNELKVSDMNKKKCAGIIGNIDRNKQVHISIKRALEDGHDDIRIFGNNHDSDYFVAEILPLSEKYPNIIKFMGYEDDRQKMYDQLTDVYHSSLSENASYVVDECKLAGITLHGNSQTLDQPILEKSQVFQIWKKELEL